VHTRQPRSAHHLGKHIEGSRKLTGSDTKKPSQPITYYTRALSLSHTSPDSDGEITGAHQLSRRGAQTPRGSHLGSNLISKGPIFSLTVTRRSCEVWAHHLGQFLGRSDEYFQQGELSRPLQQLLSVSVIASNRSVHARCRFFPIFCTRVFLVVLHCIPTTINSYEI
jgi:hypothetical protein